MISYTFDGNGRISGTIVIRMTPYDDEFPTCVSTSATLRIFTPSVSPMEVSALLGLAPSESFCKGDPIGSRGGVRKFNGWLMRSEDHVASRDTRVHIDWILAQLAPHEHELAKLRQKEAEIDISCLWVSAGQGGPILSTPQTSILSKLDLEIWWDVYFDQQAGES